MDRIALLFAGLALASATASAQSVRYARPYRGGYGMNYGFDHRAGGGCTDYVCGGACYDGHSGNDYGTPLGTDVLAAASGRVSATNDGCANYGYLGNTCGGRCGNYVAIQHDDGSRSIYCHMRLGSIRVRAGQRVGCGQVIGQSASSGNSTGPHLHFGHRSPGASSSDPYAGACSRRSSLWTSQGAYRGAPGTGCQGPACSLRGEVCDGRDQDCDGRVDEGLVRGCGTDVGECRAGRSTCRGGRWSGCEGAVEPRPESCDGRDEDCDGASDEALARRCGSDVGACVSGVESCREGSWGACEGAVWPTPEVCNAVDDDCDGEPDDERICEREEVAWSAPFAGATASDVDGDGRPDACARRAGRFRCTLAADAGFGRELLGPPLPQDAGFAGLWGLATLRMGDVDGDGRADLCAPVEGALRCWKSDGRMLDALARGPALDGDVTEHQLADVNGDGMVDACARSAAGMRCALADGVGFGERWELEALSDAAGFGDVIHHGSIRFGDLDGDGAADVCARGAEGVACWLGGRHRFGRRVRGPRWGDAEGNDALDRWSTLRIADVDGDGRGDVCMRTSAGLRCARFDGEGFGAVVRGPALDGEAWTRREVFGTLRMGDVDGDGRADLCAREPAGVRCWLAGERGFDRRVEGPALSDAEGWDAPERYRSLRLSDVDGDGRADLCARHAEGLRCARSTGRGFDRVWVAPSWADGAGLEGGVAATIRVGEGLGVRRAQREMGGGCAAGGPGGGSGGGSGAGLFAWLLVGLVARRRRARMAGPDARQGGVALRRRGGFGRRLGGLVGGLVLMGLAGCASEPGRDATAGRADGLVVGADAVAALGAGQVLLDVAADGRVARGTVLPAPPNGDALRTLRLEVEGFPELEDVVALDAVYVGGGVAVLGTDHALRFHAGPGAPARLLDRGAQPPLSAAAGRVAYARGEGMPFFAIARVGVASGRVEVLREGACWSPGLAPDGEALVYACSEGGRPRLFVHDGAERAVATERFPSAPFAPRFDGRRVTFGDAEGTVRVDVVSGAEVGAVDARDARAARALHGG